MPKKPNQYGVKKRGEKWTARPYVPGRGHVWAGTHDTEEEALAAAIAKIDEERRLPANKETIGTFVTRWIKDFPRPKESTNDSYRGAAKRFAAEHGDRKLHQFTVPEAMEWARGHRTDVPALRAMYGDARRSGLVVENFNPFSKLGFSSGRGRKDIVAITEGELEVLADLALTAHGKHFGPVFRSIVIFAAYTTMRPGEIFGLERDDLDLDGERIHVRRQFHKRRIQDPKRGPRKLPYIPPQAGQALQELPARLPRPICPVTGGEIVFYGKEGQRITQPALSGYWKPVRSAFEATLDPARRAELQEARNPKHPEMDFYELRHFGATVMAELGVEPWIAAKMMGHDDGGKLFSERYSHPSDEVARERLKRAFGQNVQSLRAVEDDAEEATG